ncbi:CdaR family protein [Desulfosporosinus metallidurans]|uniref:Putative secreted protein associated with spyDAC n=1 Tax=Desulfosporosinus metallidurans TaxID=1888891 RepID=A0A1Q8QQ81_9FIRM|nr:CdaR family protein [Desulfosporosinus metallidurans]OLN29505.1 putative secreted protein associated with spyDAC [Desulfosporosinus metallidurans]
MHKMFRRNLGIKIISFLFAILFWLFVMNQGATDKLIADQTLTIPLVANGLHQNMVVMTQLPLVRVRVQGINPSANIKDIYAQIDLSGGVPGERSYIIKVNSPPGTNVVDLQPSSIKLLLDSVQEKMVPVVATVTGNPADGYQVGSTLVRPSAVNVRGPSSILGTLDKVTTEISVTGAKDTIQVSRPVSFRDKEGKPIFGPNPSADILSAYPNTVDVIVPVMTKGLSSKMIPLKVTSTGTPAQGKALRSLVPSPTSVQVLGTPQALKGFDSLNLGPVDISNLAEDKTFQISIDKVILPQGVSFFDGTTLSIIAQIGPGVIQKGISGVPVQIRNVGTGLDIGQSVPPIDIVVEGLSDSLKNLTPDQIQLWVDASGQAVGSYPDTKVYWQLPPGVTMPTTPQVSYSLKAHLAKGE